MVSAQLDESAAIPFHRADACRQVLLMSNVRCHKMNPFTDVHEAVNYVLGFEGRPEELELPISDLLQDPIGMYMALITDKVLSRGWEPAGYEQKDGYRIYRYKEMA